MSVLAEIAHRLDGWYNPFTGYGTDRDRSTQTQFTPEAWLPDKTLADLFHFDDLCSIVVSIYPDEALRRGIVWPSEGVKTWATRLGIREKLIEAATWGRLFGFGAIVLGVDDGREMTAPLAPGQHAIRWADVYDRRSMEPDALSRDPADPRFKEPEIFRVTQIDGGVYYVHRSRCLIFGGVPTAKRERYARKFADLSVLQRVYPIIRDFNAGYSSLGNMLADASQSVVKIRGLLAAIASRTTGDMTTRAQLLELSRSVARVMFLDADSGESYEKVATSFASVPESIDRLASRVAAATGIPVTRLMGQAPAGLNATGESDTRNWYDQVATYRENEIAPRIDQIVAIICPGQTASFPALWQETDAERAIREKTEADIDNIYINAEVVTPEEVLERVRARYPNAATPVLVAPAAAPGLPALPASTTDDDAAVQDQEPGKLAAAMTAAGLKACEHGRTNRCPMCGIERLRGFEMTPNGHQWNVAWRAIGASTDPT